MQRVCWRCLLATTRPGDLNSAWKRWYPDKWKSLEVERKPLSRFPLSEIVRRQRNYYQNSRDLQGALDAALLSGLGRRFLLPEKRITVEELSQVAGDSKPLADNKRVAPLKRLPESQNQLAPICGINGYKTDTLTSA